MPPQPSGTRLFLKGARDDFTHTGAIAPSSRFLARAITSAINATGDARGAGGSGRALRVLEAGAGTGALTQEILRRLPAGSHLDIYEINPVFAEHLTAKFDRSGHGSSGSHGSIGGSGGGAEAAGPSSVSVRVHNARVQEIRPDASYDAIVSGLPLNNFKPSQVRRILETLMAALKPGGVMSWFEYLLIRELKSFTTGSRERRRLRRVGRLTGGYIDRYEFRREAIFLNLPPAVVHHLRKP